MIHETMPKVSTSMRPRVTTLVARIGVIVSAVMFVLSVAAAFDVTRAPANAATNAGAAVVVSAQLPTTGQPLAAGGSATAFSLQLPVGAACSGDSASSDYRVQSYMVPGSVDPASLLYGAQGPIPLGTGASYRQPLFTTTTQRYINQTTGVASSPGGGGQVPTIPGFDFAAAPFASGPAFLPAGPYNVGIACTRAAGTVLDKYWNVVMTFTRDSGDMPSGFTWSVGSGPLPTTTTTVVGATSTSTTVAGSTTTTTSTVAGSSTTTTTVGGATTSTVAGATTTTVAGATTTTVPATTATVTPAAPTPGAGYQVTFPNCQVGETVTFSQPQSTPATVTDICKAASALGSADGPSGFRRPEQVTPGTASGRFTAAPTTPGTYTVTMTGTITAQRTTTFVVAAAATPVTTAPGVGGSPSGGNVATPGTLPSTGSSTMAIMVWGVLLLVFGRVALLLGRKPKVITDVG